MKAPHISHPGATWILASGLGAGIGAALACTIFPEAGFAENPTGLFSWKLVGFAATIGATFGLFQAGALGALLGDRSWRARIAAMLWLPASAIGIAAMIFPLWWTDAELLLMLPIAVPIAMAPGVMVLAAGQGLLAYSIAPSSNWFLRTVAGAAIGGLVGLPVAVMIGPILPGLFEAPVPGPGETIWAATTGLVIGAIQRRPLERLLESMSLPAPGRHGKFA